MNETDFINGFVRGFNEGFAMAQKQVQNGEPVVAILDNDTGTFIDTDTDTASQIWIARDSDGSLWLYRDKPKKRMADWGEGICTGQLEISCALFPEVKWEDEEPRKVELNLKWIWA